MTSIGLHSMPQGDQMIVLNISTTLRFDYLTTAILSHDMLTEPALQGNRVRTRSA